MRFKLTRCDEFVVLENMDKDICYIAISSSSKSNSTVDGLYMYHGCKHDQVENDVDGHLLIDGVDMI